MKNADRASVHVLINIYIYLNPEVLFQVFAICLPNVANHEKQHIKTKK